MITDDLKPFHSDLRAAVEAGIAIEIGEDSSPAKPLSQNDLDQLEASCANGESVPSRYKAAIETWQQSNSMIPVLEGLSTRIKAWRKIGRLFRRSLLYVLFIAALAIVGLIHFRINVLPSIESMRRDLMTIAKSVEVDGTSYTWFSQIAVILFSLFLVALICWLLVGGAAKTGWWVGGGKYIRCRTLATAARIMQLLVTKGMDSHEAAALSGQLAGLDEVGQGEMLFTIKSLDRDAILTPSWADYLLMIADRQYVATRTWGPLSIVLALGGIIVAMYVVLAYLPVVTLLFDVSRQAQS